jgi:glycine dehydrogenase subunit 1
MSLLKPPGQWGEKGADIACGEGQALGVPMSSGGPYFGFMTCKQEWIRQMPGRIVGRSVDVEGKPGFCLTLQAREQHIRRAKATSNICTNQGLLVTAATIFMSLMGPEGIRDIAIKSHQNIQALKAKLSQIPGVVVHSKEPIFHELVVQLPKPVSKVLDSLAQQNIQGGFDLSHDFPELGEALLLCSTEVHSEQDHDKLVLALKQALQEN